MYATHNMTRIVTRALFWGGLAIGGSGLATLPLAGTAQADSGVQFQSPSGNIFCEMSDSNGGQGSVNCEIADHTYALPPPPCEHSAWGGRFGIEQGSAPIMACHNDTMRPSYGFPGPVTSSECPSTRSRSGDIDVNRLTQSDCRLPIDTPRAPHDRR